MSDKHSNVMWPACFRVVEATDSKEAGELEREVAEWDAVISDQPHIQRLLGDLGELPPDELFYIQRVMLGDEGQCFTCLPPS